MVPPPFDFVWTGRCQTEVALQLIVSCGDHVEGDVIVMPNTYAMVHTRVHVAQAHTRVYVLVHVCTQMCTDAYAFT